MCAAGSSEHEPAVRYFFNVRSSGGLVSDLEGAEFATSEDAREEALLVARELIGRRLIGGDRVDWGSVIEIHPEDGHSASAVGFLEAAGLTSASVRPLSEVPTQ
jgi:hypothetical protein